MRAWLGLALLLLAGCGDAPSAEVLRAMVHPAPVVAAVPAVAGATLHITGVRQAVAMALVQDGARQRIWRSADGRVIATEGARITATAGFGTAIMATRFEGPDPLDDPRALLAGPAAARRSVDSQGADRDPASMRFGLVLDCTLAARLEAGWLVVEEACSGERVSIANRFWAEPATGAIRRSTQWIGEDLPPLTLEIS